jgi:phage terminase small subunit
VHGTPAVHPEIQDLKKRAFVLAFARTGNKAQAARVAGIHPETPYSRPWRSDHVLQAAVAQAKEVAADLIEAEAYRRAVHGVGRQERSAEDPQLPAARDVFTVGDRADRFHQADAAVMSKEQSSSRQRYLRRVMTVAVVRV